jgi:hypothetical protein
MYSAAIMLQYIILAAVNYHQIAILIFLCPESFNGRLGMTNPI